MHRLLSLSECKVGVLIKHKCGHVGTCTDYNNDSVDVQFEGGVGCVWPRSDCYAYSVDNSDLTAKLAESRAEAQRLMNAFTDQASKIEDMITVDGIRVEILLSMKEQMESLGENGLPKPSNE